MELNGSGNTNARERDRSRLRHMGEHPPYSITSDMLSPVEQIGESIGRTEEAAIPPDLRLRRINRIRTIRGSLVIEGQPRTAP